MNLVAVVLSLVRDTAVTANVCYFISNDPPMTPASNAPTALDPSNVIRMVVKFAVVISIIVHLVAAVFLLGLVSNACSCVLNR